MQNHLFPSKYLAWWQASEENGKSELLHNITYDTHRWKCHGFQNFEQIIQHKKIPVFKKDSIQ